MSSSSLNRSPSIAARLPLSGASLDLIKIIAALLMVIDHVNAIFYGDSIYWLYLVGRGAFPLFCFATAASVIRSDGNNPGAYALSLLPFAVVTQPIYTEVFAARFDAANVLFTLSVGGIFGSILLYERRLYQHLFFFFALAAGLVQVPIEFGLPGILLPAALALAVKGSLPALSWAVLLALVMNHTGKVDALHESYFLLHVLVSGASAIGITALTVLLCSFVQSPRRLLPRWSLHIFYPAHIALVGLIALVW